VRVSHRFASRADRTVAAVELACGELASMTARCSASISGASSPALAHTDAPPQRPCAVAEDIPIEVNGVNMVIMPGRESLG
jgi:hypothetical protein